MSTKGARSVLVYDTQQDTWDVFEESEVPLLDQSRFSAEWIFDAREEAEQMLQTALDAEDLTPGGSAPAPGGPGDLGANR